MLTRTAREDGWCALRWTRILSHERQIFKSSEMCRLACFDCERKATIESYSRPLRYPSRLIRDRWWLHAWGSTLFWRSISDIVLPARTSISRLRVPSALSIMTARDYYNLAAVCISDSADSGWATKSAEHTQDVCGRGKVDISSSRCRRG